MPDFKQANLVIFVSANGRDGWVPIRPDAVPDWVKNPDNIAHMVDGQICMKADEGDSGSLWYAAVRLESVAEAVSGIDWPRTVN